MQFTYRFQFCTYTGFITNNEELRIVMVGKTGSGKSASGNMILDHNTFISKFCAQSITVDCKKKKGVVCGQKVAVIDTPGLFDTRYDEEKTAKDLRQCISFAAPGPHVFLVVQWLGRFTEEEQNAVEKIQQVFGQGADRYSMVLFTGGDLLEGTIESFLAGCPGLQELVARCNNQYHVFNNKNKNDRSQVDELLQKIRNIVMKNEGSHYTNEMFQRAERAIEEEKERIMKEQEEKIEKKLQEKYEKEMKKLQETFQAKMEQEMKEREKQRQMEKQERYEEREWERKAKEEERRKERQEREWERKAKEEERKEKWEREKAMSKLREQHDKELKEEIKNVRSKYEIEAREKAEKSNPFVYYGKMLLNVVLNQVAGRFLGLSL
ncbi:GTPase IMAP family member 7-like [Betta splendens]|uniref:GTPase IMAP family member 7-like n=1 Tax=Betta splendens TaxID=158456 RepID=A0A6P7P3C1_BETSP|nr:GTPase IMAP family member 7-like [Betta splendens]